MFSVLILSLLNLSNASSERLEAVAHFNKYEQAGYNDCWGYTDEDGREYALLGVRNGTSVIEITDSSSLREVGFIPSKTSDWKDIKTYGDFAYAVNETGGGLQVIDLRGLPEKVELVATYDQFSTAHNIWIEEDRALLYVAHATPDHSVIVRLLSLQDPTRPVQLSTFGVEAHDVFARDGLAYISEGGHGTIGIYDVRNPSKPELVSRFQIPRAGYVHNAWLSEGGSILMTTEETKGKTMKLWDLTDLSNVRMTGEYIAPNKLAHNTHIKGNYAYVSHYGSGLRIVDISNPHAPVEVAHFLKGTTDNKGSFFDGGFVDVWGAFPFFASGKILVSDISSGLYVVEFKGARDF